MSQGRTVEVAQLRRFSPLDGMKKENQAALAKKVFIRELEPGRLLFKQGDTDKRTIWIVTGTVEMSEEAVLGHGVLVVRPNGWRFSCGGGSANSTILNDSAAWPRGTSWSGEPWPRSAVSYKRWLGSPDCQRRPRSSRRRALSTGSGNTPTA